MKKIVVMLALVSLSACAVREEKVQCLPLGGVSEVKLTKYKLDGTKTETTTYGYNTEACGEDND